MMIKCFFGFWILAVTLFTATGVSADDQISKKFRGEWILVGYLDKSGERHKPKKAHVLLLKKNTMVRTEIDGRKSPGFPAGVQFFISDVGRVWIIAPDTGEEIDLATVEIKDSELHFVGLRNDHHLIYEIKKKDKKVEQDDAGKREETPDSLRSGAIDAALPDL